MKKKALIKALKNVPDDVDVKIRTYGYSQGQKDLFDIERIQEDTEHYIIILVTE